MTLLACAGLLAGCGGTNVFSADAGWFSRPMDFGKPDWNLFTNNTPELNQKKAVGPEDLVAADGTCAPAPEPPAPAANAPANGAPADKSTSGSAAVTPPAPPPDRLEPGPAGPGPSFGRLPAGGVALGMTECQVVRRAGQPQTVTIGAAAGGERTAVVTYLAGNWPGIYHFEAGRLKVVDQAPQAASPEKAQKSKKPKKKTRAPAKTAGAGTRVYVQ